MAARRSAPLPTLPRNIENPTDRHDLATRLSAACVSLVLGGFAFGDGKSATY